MHTPRHLVSPAVPPSAQQWRRRAAAAWCALLFAVGALCWSGAATAGAVPGNTAVTASASQVASELFVAGDVQRLSQEPSGTVDVALEQVLQQLYRDNPMLPVGDAVSAIQNLQGAVSGAGAAGSAATLADMAPNERIVNVFYTMLSASKSDIAPDIDTAITQVVDRALTESSNSLVSDGQAFDAGADSQSTLSYGDFSPAETLQGTTELAQQDAAFGEARDALWESDSHESVFSDTDQLLASDPALDNPAVKSIVSQLNADGSLDSTTGDLETAVDAGVSLIDAQACANDNQVALAAVTTAGHARPAGETGAITCTSGALHDAEVVEQACPNGPSTNTSACTEAIDNAKPDVTVEEQTIADEEAATTFDAGLLGEADSALQKSEFAAEEASSELVIEETDFLNTGALGILDTFGEDAGADVGSLSLAELNPVFAVAGLLSIVQQVLGGFNGPNPDTLILQAIQNVSTQLSAFEQFTATAFGAINSQLSTISGQVALESFQLSTQINNVQQAVNTLGGQLTNLQDSVDHLQSEVQSLFAAGANNDLGTIINTDLGYQAANGVPLPQQQFANAAGMLLQDATSTALSPTVLAQPSGYDALDAYSQLIGSGSADTLNANINFFNQFPLSVTDSPFQWSGSLTSGCAANGNAAQGVCLPNPAYWSTASRAFAQLLLENPGYVTPAREQQLQAMQQEGQLLQQAIAQISAANDGGDAGGTGNTTLDNALNYFLYWGEQNHSGSTPPSLAQALENAEQAYLQTQLIPGQGTLSAQGVNPWGGATQTPDVNNIVGETGFSNVPLCSGYAGLQPGYISNPDLPQLNAQQIENLPPLVLNAVRLGIGSISDCWFANLTTRANNQPGIQMNISFSYQGPAGTNIDVGVGDIDANASGNDCAFNPQASNGTVEGEKADAIASVLERWPGVTTVTQLPSCPDVYDETLQPDSLLTNPLPSDVSGYLTTAVTARLTQLGQGADETILNNGSTLSSGTGDATNVAAAAERTAGADALLDGYIRLGLSQALSSDDTLQGLVNGAAADPLTQPQWNTPFAPDVVHQVIDLYQAADQNDTTVDPATLVGPAIAKYGGALATALADDIEPHAFSAVRATAAVTAGPGQLAEENPLVTSTVDRLALTQQIVTAALNGTLNTSATTTTTSATTRTGSTSTSPTSTSTSTSTETSTNTTTTATSTPAPAPQATDPTTTTSTTTSSASSAAASSRHGARVACTLAPSNGKVLLTARPRRGKVTVRPGALTLAVRCNQAARVSLTGTVSTATAKAKFAPVRGSVKPGVPLTLALRLPAASLRSLALGKRERASFVLTAVNAVGAGTANATVPRLVPVR